MEIREPLIELRSTRLFQRLSELDGTYAENAARFVDVVTPILASTARHFPYYTRHDAHHGYRVLRRIEQVVEPDCLEGDGAKAFGAAEIFLLILAAYAHDLGMTIFPGEVDAVTRRLGIDTEAGWETDTRLQSYLRREHSSRGGRYIHEHSERFGVPVNLVDALDKIMRAHNLSIHALESEIPDSYAAEERLIDVRQLAVILCVADALEFSDTRVVDGVLEAIGKDSSAAARLSYLENMKHVCVGDSLAIDANGQINVSGTFDEAEVLALAHRTFDEIEGWVSGYCDLDRRMMTQRLRIRPEPIARNLALPGRRFERLGVRLNKRNVISLIASNAVWRGGGPVIRELLQNAVEACRYRRYYSSAADAYIPTVSVVFDRNRHEIVVEDNGCGMSERVILNNLLTVGSSRSAEPGYASAGYAPIARFGVGFWSVFTLAETAHVETAPFESHRGDPNSAVAALGTAFDVSLDELKEYTVFSPITRPCGTKVRLRLHSDVSIDDTFSNARAQILCSDVEVSLRLDDDEVTIPLELPNVPYDELLGARTAVLEKHDMKLFEWRGSSGDTTASLLLAYRTENDKPTFLLNEHSSVMNAFEHVRHARTTVCGFAAPIRERHLCFDLGRVGVCFANRSTPMGISYALDRSQLISNNAAEEFSQDVTRLVHDGYRAFLTKTNGSDLATIAALRQQASMHGGNVYDIYTGNALQVAAENFPDLMPFKLHPLSGEAPVYVRADEIHTLKGKVIFQQERPTAKIADGRYISFDNEGEAGVSALLQYLAQAFGRTPEPIYAMEADILASMLFDADPDSTVFYVPTSQFGDLCLQMVQLERVDVRRPGEVLAEVQGRWSGTIYLRDFERPSGKPYAFLGRHRVLIRRSSLLAAHFQEMANGGRYAKLSGLVADLKEDGEGYTPSSVANLLSAR